MQKKDVFMLYAADEGCRMHRILSPARFLNGDLPATFSASARPDEHTDNYDAYVIHGLPVAETINHMARHQTRGMKWVWSVDDDYMTIPPWNPCRVAPDKLAAWKVSAKVSDAIIVSTPALGRTFAGADCKTHVCPNLIDIGFYPNNDPPPWPAPRNLTILWAGSHTHLFDVQAVVPAVRHVLRKYEGKVPIEFIFFGQAPPAELVTEFLHRGVHWQHGVDLSLYWSVLLAIRPHIVMAPLYPCAFNESKSNIRVLDGWAMTAAVVASPVGEYAVVNHDEDGLLAATDDDWCASLERLIGDHEYREKLARAGRARVEREYDWRRWECRKPWRDAFAKILELEVEDGQPTNRLLAAAHP